jgi:SecD/SecF fusion protein
MRRFLTRILVCLLPVLVSGVVVAKAVSDYVAGRGGFRMGVDLVGGTILVYEVDETKMPQDFKAEDLAAALKKRIDPNDLYNVTIRPVQGTPPRVEIILPTGGRYQIEAEQRAWDRLLTEAAEQYPVEGNSGPYADVSRGDRLELIERILKANPKLKREEVSTWVNQRAGSKDKRFLTSEQVEEIKTLISRQGRLEFRILANRVDDPAALAAAEEWIKDKKNEDELKRLDVRAEPPPPPRNKDDGSTNFPVTLPNEPAHSYSWVELGKSELHSRAIGLNNDAVRRGPLWDTLFKPADPSEAAQYASSTAFKARWDEEKKPNPDNWAVKTPVLQFPGEGRWLLYVRKISDWSRRSQKDREMGKRFEYFMLVRDPLRGQEITGDYLTRAAPGTDNRGRLSIDFTFNADGGNLFQEVTSKNKPSSDGLFHRHLAIIFDGQIASAPSLITTIRTNGQITGEFTQQEVTDMVRILRAGALPATLKKEPASQNSMGSTLGQDTIDKGTRSVLLAFLAVLLFMLFYYRFAGLVACVALLANLLLTVAFMVLVNAAFTLPGLAGLVLMLGMAVDANVLIYERLREERERGASLALALRNGYDRAFPTIIDTHLSSIFTAIVLYVVGNDQLKGFGITLTVGLIISLFTSLYMTRTIFEIWMFKGWLRDLRFGHLKFGKLDLHHAHFDFMAIRYYWFTATIVLTILGAGLFIYRLDKGGLNIDFVGGTAYTARLTTPMNMVDLRKAFENSTLQDLAIEQIFLSTDPSAGGASTLVTIRTSEKDFNKVIQEINDHLGPNLKRIYMSYQVQPDGKEATLTFCQTKDAARDPKKAGAEQKDYASTEQVRRLLGDQLAAMDVPRAAVALEKVEVNRDGLASVMKVKLTEVVSPAKFQTALAQTQQLFEKQSQPERLEQFDKQLADNTKERALYAILASWLAIMLYLWFRFGSWTFGAATVLCLIHDLFFTLGAIALCHFVAPYSFFHNVLGIHDFKIDLPSVAALLTLVGYSVNDTIVVFDRIREVRGKNPLLTPKMINDSVNQTLSRTLLASMSVWVVVIVLFFFGGEGVKLFAFVMVVGVIVGTYSSIYIASPLLLIFGEGARAAAIDRARAPQPAEQR